MSFVIVIKKQQLNISYMFKKNFHKKIDIHIFLRDRDTKS